MHMSNIETNGFWKKSSVGNIIFFHRDSKLLVPVVYLLNWFGWRNMHHTLDFYPEFWSKFLKNSKVIYVIHLPLKFPTSILIKILEEFHWHLILFKLYLELKRFLHWDLKSCGKAEFRKTTSMGLSLVSASSSLISLSGIKLGSKLSPNDLAKACCIILSNSGADITIHL